MPPMNSSRTITVRSVKGSRSQLIFPLRTKSAAVVLISAGTFNLGSGPHHSAQTFSYAVQRIPSDPLGCIVAITVEAPHAFKLPRYGVRGPEGDFGGVWWWEGDLSTATVFLVLSPEFEYQGPIAMRVPCVRPHESTLDSSATRVDDQLDPGTGRVYSMRREKAPLGGS